MSSSSIASSAMPSFFASPHFLRRVLLVDAASGVGTALLHCEFADALAPLLGLPTNLLLWSGYALGAFVLFIAWIASRKTIPAGPVWLLIAANAVWVLGCVGLLASSAVAPTVFGEAFLIVQAVFVGVLVELEWIGLRKIQPEPSW
nr:hypothetical protein [Rhodoferax sp.]